MPHTGTVSPTTIIIIIGQKMHGEPENEANSPILCPNHIINTYRDFQGDHYKGQENAFTRTGQTTHTV